MQLKQILEELPLIEVSTIDPHREVTGGYASDLLSDVIAKSGEGSIWVTNQAHANVAAVAVLTEAAAVIVAGGIEPDPDLVAKAKDNAVNLLRTDLPCFEVVGRLYQLGIQGVVKE